MHVDRPTKSDDAKTGGMRGIASGLVLAALALAGCATGAPRTIPAPRPVPDQWQGAALVPEVATAEKTADLSRWWQALGDPVVSDLIERARAGSPNLASARARLREARARRGLSGQDLFPSRSLSVSAAFSNRSGADELYDAGIDASWEVDVFGATRRAVSAAQADLEAVEASLHDTQVSLVAEVARNYVELRSSQARLAIAQQSLDRQAETLALTTWRAEGGLTSSLDVEQARANLELTRAQIPSLETSLAEAEHRLAILLGQAPGTLRETLSAPGPIPRVPERVAIGIPADTLRQRPDVRAAERRLAAEVARLGQAKAARFPSLKLSKSTGLEAITPSGLFDTASFTRSLLAGLTAPILDYKRIRLRIDIQDAAREQALVAYDQTVLAAFEEVENALVALANARRRQAALTSAVEAARNAAQLARVRYTAGMTSYQTVLDTERSVLSAEDGLTSSEAEGVSALIRLYKALGGGWTTTAVREPKARTRSEES
jgi:NodT family efflux transporter outer membrane factor (OMF) lipoprotein